jgi:hypothetical protein
MKPGVAVEKLHFRQNTENLGDRKCPGKPRTAFVGHPDAISFLRISPERVFQQPQAISLIDSEPGRPEPINECNRDYQQLLTSARQC